MKRNILAEFEAIIFDLDGTLVDSNESHVESWDRAFRKFGKEFSRKELRSQIGKGSDQYLPHFLSTTEMEEFGQELDQYRSRLFKEEYLRNIKPFPNVRDLFEKLAQDGKRTVLATSGKREAADHYIELLGIGEMISGLTTADDAEKSKPEPDIFIAALEKVQGVRPSQALVVGDTRFDIAAADQAGIRTVALLCGGTPEEVLRNAGAIAIYRDPADLLAALTSEA